MWEFIRESAPQFAGVLVGAIVTWLVSRHFYKRAGEELTSEAGRIRKLANLIGSALEQTGPVEFKRDDKGEITAIYVPLKATGRIKLGGKATLTVEERAEDSETPKDTH